VTSAAVRTEPRTLAPPERRIAQVSGVERLGAYRVITALDGSGPVPRPGQFYMLASERRWGGGVDERPYLPRAFSYARARPGRDGLELDFLLEAVGPGTERLAELEPDEGLALVGPLGVGFRPPPPGASPVLVGGGIGAAPLLCLQDELIEAAARKSPTVLLGFRTAAHAQAAALFAGAPEIATDDGSVGRPGLVTELLRDLLSADAEIAVFACGPPAMLEAVRSVCAEHGVPAQLALESGMACGFGACFGCVVPTKSGYIRLCVEGPVVDAGELETALFPGAGH
jgi:dihydroorotate dehydrogenase electron transfer subunit